MESADLDILKMEYDQACNQRKYLDDQANKYVSYIVGFLGAIGAFLGLLMKDGQVVDSSAIALIIIAGTLITGILTIMMLHHTVQCYRMGGYIKYLEEEINKKLSFEILKWETVVAEKYVHKDSASLLVYSMVGVFFAVLLFVAGILSVEHLARIAPVIFGVVLAMILLEIATVFVYIIKLATAHKTIYKMVARSAESTE